MARRSRPASCDGHKGANLLRAKAVKHDPSSKIMSTNISPIILIPALSLRVPSVSKVVPGAPEEADIFCFKS